jgi:hypothetical protein
LKANTLGFLSLFCCDRVTYLWQSKINHLTVMEKKLKKWMGWPRLLLILSIWIGMGMSAKSCPDQRSPFPISMRTYGAGEIINVSEHNSVFLRRGDVVTLYNTEQCSIQEIAGLYLEMGASGLVVKVKNDAPVNVPLNAILIPCYNFTIYVVDAVWPGDANADGKRDMYDLMPIALGIRNDLGEHGTSNLAPFPPTVTVTVTVASSDQFYPVLDWAEGFTLGERSVDYKHADCNGDGKITLADIEVLMAVLSPLTPTQFLNDGFNSLLLKAIIDQSGVMPAIINDEQFGLQIPFFIEVFDGIPPAIFGAVFTRPLSGANLHPVHSTVFSFEDSNVIGPLDKDQMIARQKFWDMVDVVSVGRSCFGIVDNPLDVAFFKSKDPLINAGTGSRYGTCTVTLLDILRPNGTFVSTVDIAQHFINGLVYIVDDNKVKVRAIDCTSETTSINIGNFCTKSTSPPMMRDGINDKCTLPSVPDSSAWASPDIWISYSKNGEKTSQNPVTDDLVWVNVRVFNGGCNPIDNLKVDVHWTGAKTDESWPDDFSGQVGGIAGTLLFPSIDPWSSKVQQFYWKVPVVSSSIANAKPMLSLLAIAQYPGNTSVPLGHLRSSVLANRHIAMRSSSVLFDEMGTSTLVSVQLKNPSSGLGDAKLTLTQIEGPADDPVSNYGTLLLSNIPTAISITKSHMTGGSNPGSYSLDIDNAVGFIQLNGLDPGFVRDIGVSFARNSQVSNLSGPLHYSFLLIMEVNGVRYNGSVFEITIR